MFVRCLVHSCIYSVVFGHIYITVVSPSFSRRQVDRARSTHLHLHTKTLRQLHPVKMSELEADLDLAYYHTSRLSQCRPAKKEGRDLEKERGRKGPVL